MGTSPLLNTGCWFSSEQTQRCGCYDSRGQKHCRLAGPDDKKSCWRFKTC